MKSIFPLLLILATSTCFAQPTGHQKLFLEIIDQQDTIHFEQCFRKLERRQKNKLTRQNYQLQDVSSNPTGFEFYPEREYIHKTLMADDHHIQVVKNNTDTMNIEIRNAFNVYFLRISFQKGNFKLYVNDAQAHKWHYQTLPFKKLNAYATVYDITPPDWSIFRTNPNKTEYDYFISTQYEKSGILAKPIAPEDDPNFRNPRRINNLKIEVADYNFDGQKDYREQKMKDTTKWNYFIYTHQTSEFVLDTLLSNLDYCSFDFEKKGFWGQKTTRIDPTHTQTDNFEYVNGSITLVRQLKCVHTFPHSERMDCSVYELKNGALVFKELIKGCE